MFMIHCRGLGYVLTALTTMTIVVPSHRHRRRWTSLLAYSTLLVLLSLGASWVNIRGEIGAAFWTRLEAKAPTLYQPMPRTEDAGYDGRPPLSDLLVKIGENRSEITGDVDWLMDYAIVGHSKTATSDIMRWLCRHPEVVGNPNEVRSLYHRRPDELVELLYNLPMGRHLKRGYKHPLDIVFDYTTDYFREYWPSTRLIVGVRHPVRWFESWYNFRVRFRGENFRGNDTSVDPLAMVGKRLPFQMFYHRHLAMLGKTSSHKDADQLRLLAAVTGMSFPIRPVSPNKVFLYDVSQPFDRDPDRSAAFRHDLQDFLGLNVPLKPLRARNSSRNYHYSLDICEPEYTNLRGDILKIGEAASDWIVTYFLDHPDVTVPCKQRFIDVLRTWSSDPCNTETNVSNAVTEEPVLPPTPFVSMNSSRIRTPTSRSPSWQDLGKPPLDELVNGTDIRAGADVEFLLNFGMVGHSKTATTYLQKWISQHNEVLMFQREIHFLTTDNLGLFVQKMYSLPAGSWYRRGYKAPNDISRGAPRRLLQTYFPHADLIIGIRHPVKWFESWYNFNSRKAKPTTNPNVSFYEENLPYQIKFHVHLALMGKTKYLQSEDEMALLQPYLSGGIHAVPDSERMGHRVFLYEVSQPFDRNETRNAKFRQDFSSYLGLSSTLSPVTVRNVSRNFHFSIDVCEDRYVPIRQNLLRFGKASSAWILNYFLDLDEVFVSDKDHFVDLLRSWEHDPCESSTANG